MKRTIEVANVLLQNSLSAILLLQRAPRLINPHIWGLPGGVVDKGETDLFAGMRELKEETEITESSLTIAGITRFLVETPHEDLKITTIHALSSLPHIPVRLNPDEHTAHKWVSEADIYRSADLLPGSPTMIASVLHDNVGIIDLTMSNGIYVTKLR